MGRTPGGLHHGRHHQRGKTDADTGATVIHADQQAAAPGVRGTQARRQQATRDKHQRAGDSRQQTLHQPHRGVGEKTAGGHQHTGRQAAPHQQHARTGTAQQRGRDEGAEQVTGRIAGVHRTGQRITPAQVGTHRRQQQAVGEPRDAQRHRRPERQRQRDTDGVGGRRRTRQCLVCLHDPSMHGGTVRRGQGPRRHVSSRTCSAVAGKDRDASCHPGPAAPWSARTGTQAVIPGLPRDP